MKLNIANYFEADRRTAVAGQDLPLGAVIKLAGDGNGNRVATLVAASGDLVEGKYGIAFKVSNDPFQVTTTYVPVEYMGSRLVTIKSGDNMVECREGCYMEYDPSLLDASLDPNRSGVLPKGGDALGVLNGLPCAAGAAGAITSPVVLRCYTTIGTKVVIEIL